MKICSGSVRHIVTEYVLYMPTNLGLVTAYNIEARGNNGLLHWDCRNGYYVCYQFKTLRRNKF